MKRFLAACFAAVSCFALVQPASAKTLALLIGVANYDEGNGIRDLLGPRNDVTAMWRVLQQRGVNPADMTVLTDGLPTSPQYPAMNGGPRYAEIIGALDHLAKQAQKGDTVIFYYSGHGTYQPDRDPQNEEEPEASGYDQVLLPADSGKFSPIGAGIKNALVDDELGAKLGAIRATGATVWAIVDSCHSGTVTRGTQVTRSVDPASLGVPMTGAPPSETTRSGKRSGVITVKESAGLVGFYAVDATVEAIEQPFPGYDLPMVGEGDKQRMGVFTYLLHRALSKGDAVTYRELAQEIVAEHVSDVAGGRAPPPVFDGALDQPILGDGKPGAPRLVQGIVNENQITVPAGALHGFDSGAKLALYAPGKQDEAIGHAIVVSANAATSVAGEINWEPGVDKIKTGPVSLKVTEPAVSFRFTVAPPPPEEATPVVTRLIDTAFGKGSGSDDIGIDLDQPGNTVADVSLRVADGKLWILRPEQKWVREAGGFDETPSVALDGDPAKLAENLKQSIWLYARAAKLVRVTAAAAETKSGEGDEEQPGITITASLNRDEAGANSPRSDCAAKAAAPLPAQAIEPMIPVAAANCDVIEIKITNKSDYGYYVGGFYVSANGEVSPLKKADIAKGCVRSLPANTTESITYKVRIQTWDAEHNRPSSIGVEDAAILAIPQDDTNIAPRLCSLIQPSIAAMQATRGVDNPSATRGRGRMLGKLLTGITGSASRGGVEMDDGEEGPAMAGKLFVFDLKP